MKKHYLYLATALALASCANDDYLDGTSPLSTGDGYISFSMSTPNATRGDQQLTGKDAAIALNNEFIVWGEKNEADNTATKTEDLVFKNYRVQYKENTNNTTTSNTAGWEYVGLTPYESSKVSPSIHKNANAKQTIKYWEFGKTYTFTAVSAYQSDITNGNVKITKTEGSTTLASKVKGYTIVLTQGAKATDIFVADRKEVKYETTAQSVSAVQMQFRNFQSKIRFGFYETVPGYNVQITGVKYDTKADYVTTAFGVDGKFVQVPTGTSDNDKLTYTVTYDTNNKPVVDVTTGSNTATKSYEEFGSYVFSKDLGTTATSDVVYDKENGAYSLILPNTNNDTPMSFTVSYKLISEDTGEEITVTDKKVTVPAAYCKWKPNFAYTYLFKVSDQSTGLYPITFDAVVEADEVSKQETITEVGEPSITTFAVKSDGKTVVVDQDEYQGNNTIYATINTDGGMTSSNTKLYTVTATSYASGITEASVANCLAHGKKGNDTAPTTWTATDLNNGVLTVTAVTISSDGSSTPAFVDNVPSEDGNGTRTVNALKWTATASTVYAVEYTNGGNKTYKIVKVGTAEQ